jgi:polyisoprenoid-binding protein YceI
MARRSAGRDGRMVRARARAVLALMAVGIVAMGAAGHPSFRLDHADVQVTVPLRPGGAFNATTTALTGTLSVESLKPAKLDGEVAVDLRTIDTGIALRNEHLRDKYLEVAKGEGYDKAVLSGLVLADAGSETFSGTSGFTATLLLHGVKHEVAGKAEIRPEGAGHRVRAEFPVTLTDFGVSPPEYLGVGVGSRLLVKVNLLATSAAEAAPAH